MAKNPPTLFAYVPPLMYCGPMTTNEAPKRTTLDVMESQAKAELNFLTEKLESNLKWLESEIRNMRRDVSKGSIFPSTNMTKMAADTDQIHTRLKYATEALMTIQTLQEEAK